VRERSDAGTGFTRRGRETVATASTPGERHPLLHGWVFVFPLSIDRKEEPTLNDHSRSRRSFIAGSVAALAVGSGCVTEGAFRENPAQGTESGPCDELAGVDFHTCNSQESSPGDPPSVFYDRARNRVFVAGGLTSGTCTEIVLETATYDADEDVLSLVVGREDQSEGKNCPLVAYLTNYVVESRFNCSPPERVEITEHRGVGYETRHTTAHRDSAPEVDAPPPTVVRCREDEEQTVGDAP